MSARLPLVVERGSVLESALSATMQQHSSRPSMQSLAWCVHRQRAGVGGLAAAAPSQTGSDVGDRAR